MQTNFIVEIIMTNKEMARDPVGATIKRDLLAKKGYDMISNVRSGQYLRIHISAENETKAKEIIEDMCNRLRIFNPVTQNLTILRVSKS
ncbi:MAG: phosphoribosylformylglycinamidine synthase subunit PurS [Candidatus Lokiarchaeota archaeon]|nr:phosphoribosylformylglycinamidine synthase subunit PurS [Candidatus Lokiarchaeota archaeon]